MLMRQNFEPFWTSKLSEAITSHKRPLRLDLLGGCLQEVRQLSSFELPRKLSSLIIARDDGTTSNRGLKARGLINGSLPMV